MTHTHATVVGAGNVGLATTALLLTAGHSVSVIDTDEGRIADLARGDLPIKEPGLDDIIDAGTRQQKVEFASAPTPRSRAAAVAFLCVGTPMLETGDPDMSSIESALASLDRGHRPTVVAIRSTVPQEPTQRLSARFRHMSFVSHPEFLQQGSAVRDSLEPSRIVIGARDPENAAAVLDLIRPALHGSVPEIITTPKRPKSSSTPQTASSPPSLHSSTRSLTYARPWAPTSRSLPEVWPRPPNRSFIPPRRTRLRRKLSAEGLAALARLGERLGSPSLVTAATVESNRRRRDHLAERVLTHVDRDPTESHIAVLGLTFKLRPTTHGTARPWTSCTDSCTADARSLCSTPKPTSRYSTASMPPHRHRMQGTRCAGADAIVIATEWREFRELDLATVARSMRGDLVIDLRNLLDVAAVSDAGLTLHRIGAPAVGRGLTGRRAARRG